jgi:hypothetical protein
VWLRMRVHEAEPDSKVLPSVTRVVNDETLTLYPFRYNLTGHIVPDATLN